MSELAWLPIFLFGWFALFRWVLPAIGIPTCLSGSCGYPVDPSANDLQRSERIEQSAGPENQIR